MSEPRGSGSDSAPAGKARLPGGSGKQVAVAPAGDDPRALEALKAIGSLSPDEFMAGVDEWIAVRPEGTTLSEFLAERMGV